MYLLGIGLKQAPTPGIDNWDQIALCDLGSPINWDWIRD
jgi:hypothetical protein